MDAAHRILANATVAALAVGIVWSIVLAARAQPGGRSFERFQFVIVGLVLIAAIAGAPLLASGGRPREDLHLVYAAIAIGVIPLARSFVPGQDRRRILMIFLAFVVLGGVVFRLFGTG